MEKKPRILFLDAPTVDLADLDLRPLKRQGVYRPFSLTAKDPLPPEARNAQIFISNKYYLGAGQFKLCPRLRLVAVAATGVNNVDLDATRQAGIAVANVVGYSTPTVAEHALLFLLALSHRLLEHYRSATSGEWSRGPYYADLSHPYSDLGGKTLGIVGYGNIGRAVARLAKAFGMKVLLARIPGRKYSASAKHVPLDNVLRSSDFVTIHCPLTDLTQGLFDEKNLRKMKARASLLNLARGPIVVSLDVARALKEGRIAGYATDVLETEPPPLDHPLLDPALKGRVLLTPHIAWASRESRQRMVEELAKNIAAFRRGKKRNRVV
jgi:Lactate dehydrogenase and related dehydrogenases